MILEVNVNRLVSDYAPSDLSGSIAERGANAGKETWANSVAAAEAPVLANDAERAASRRYWAEFGAWDEEEIAAWSDRELDAMVLQYAAGDLRELQSCCPGDGIGDVDWDEAETLAQEGRVSGNLFAHNGELYITLS